MKPWEETWTTNGWCGPYDNGFWPWHSISVRVPYAKQPEAGQMIHTRENYGDNDARERLAVAAPELYRMLAECAEHIDMVCMCGSEDAGGEVVTTDRCWQCRIQAALRKARGE